MNIKKTLVGVLIVIISFSMIGCTSSYEDTGFYFEDESGESTLKFKGTFRIKSETTDLVNFTQDSESSSISDLILKRYRDVADKYGCAISVDAVQPGTIHTNMMTSAATSGSYADIVELSASEIYDLYRGGFLSALESMSGFDVTDPKWGSDGAKESMTMSDGKLYGFTDGFWVLPFPSVSGVVLYNHDLINGTALKSPYEYYEQENWTWDAFEKLCVSLTVNVSDDYDGGQYAFATPSTTYPAFVHAAIYSNGGDRVVTEPDQSLVCGYNDMKVTEALDWVYKLVHEDAVSYDLRETSTIPAEILAFINSTTVFLITESDTAFNDNENYPLSEIESLRMISFPQGPKFNKTTTAFYSEKNKYFAASKGIDKKSAGHIISDIFEPLDGDDAESWKRWIQHNCFIYEEDFDIFYDMIAGARTDNSLLTTEANLTIEDFFIGVINGRKTSNEAVQQLEHAVTGILSLGN